MRMNRTKIVIFSIRDWSGTYGSSRCTEQERKAEARKHRWEWIEQKLLFSLLGIGPARTDLQDVLNRKVMIQFDTNVHCIPKGHKDGEDNLCEGVWQLTPNHTYRVTIGSRKQRKLTTAMDRKVYDCQRHAKLMKDDWKSNTSLLKNELEITQANDS